MWQPEPFKKDPGHWRSQLYEVIFGVETKAGQTFDIILLWAILASVTAVILESVTGFQLRYGSILRTIEWIFTVFFTVEYVLRLLAVRRPWRYARSFFGLVDLLAILPTYASLIFAGYQSLLVIRAVRLLRVFRVFKLLHFLGEAEQLRTALSASRHKITVFIGGVLTAVLIIGALMHLIEGAESGFSSVPQSMYWAIVTMTTVGYGDIAPATIAGKVLASIMMLLGYGIIAIPTGIVSVEINRATMAQADNSTCCHCQQKNLPPKSQFCHRCGVADPVADRPSEKQGNSQ